MEGKLEREIWCKWIGNEDSVVPPLDRVNDSFNNKFAPWIMWYQKSPDEDEKKDYQQNEYYDLMVGIDVKARAITEPTRQLTVSQEEYAYCVVQWPKTLEPI